MRNLHLIKSNLFGILILCLGLWLIFMLWLLSKHCSLFTHWSLSRLCSLSFYVVLEALFSSLVYKVLNVLAFFYKQHCLVLMRYGLFSGNCWITVAGYHLLSMGSQYMTFWPMGISCVGEDNNLSFTQRISAIGGGAWLIPICTLAACDNGRSVRACLPYKICISDCKIPFRGVFL